MFLTQARLKNVEHTINHMKGEWSLFRMEMRQSFHEFTKSVNDQLLELSNKNSKDNQPADNDEEEYQEDEEEEENEEEENEGGGKEEEGQEEEEKEKENEKEKEIDGTYIIDGTGIVDIDVNC